MSDILKDLNLEQKQAVTTTEGPLLIIAGAGTGKTAVIARRIAYIIEKRLAKPSEILALTFTDKAAAEMEERVDILVPYGFIDTWISTFHAFGDRILRDNVLEIGLSPDFKVLSRPQQVLFFQQNLFRFNLEYYLPLSNPTKFISAILSFFSRLKDENINPEEFSLYSKRLATDARKEEKTEGPERSRRIEAKKYQELASSYQQYEKFKDEAGFLDFGDQVVKTIELFQKRPKILKKYQDQFKYILVDEYQDTNYAQNELVKLLAASHKNICVVGDDDQCLPPGTLITTSNGKRKIEKLKISDQVLTAVGKGHLGISKITKVFKNRKTARLLTVKTKSGCKLTLTDNHKVFCYVPSKVSQNQYHYVYLMYRQNLGWRIGVTNDLATRLRLERSADKIIGIRAFRTDSEARYYEMFWALKYGIPPTVFQERIGIEIKGDSLMKLYKDIDSYANAAKLAQDLHIDLNSSHYTLNAVTRGSSRRIKINLEICSRNYHSKSKEILKSPLIAHTLHLETTNPKIIKLLQDAGYQLQKAKKGLRLRIQSSDLLNLGKLAQKITDFTGGFLEAKFALGFASFQSKPALIMPASNLVLGHRVPIVVNNRVYYDEIIEITEEEKTLTVYDLEIEKTHNFIANNIVVHNSIYKFRGAAISNILEFKKTYPKAHQVVLNQNYRSTQSILNSAYRLIRHNDPDRLEVQNKIDKKLKAVWLHPRGELGIRHGLSPQEIFADTISEEADLVAAEIEKLMAKRSKYLRGESSSHLGGGRDGYSYRDFAILVRANAQADHFLRALNMKGIPHKFVGSSGLYQQEEVNLLISFLTAISNFEDSLNLFNLSTSDVYKMPPADAIKLASYAKRKNRSLYYVLKNLDRLTPQHRHSGEERSDDSRIKKSGFWTSSSTVLSSSLPKGQNDSGISDLDLSEESKAIIEKLLLDLDESIKLSRRENVGKVTYGFLKTTGYLKKLERQGGVENQLKIQNIAKFFDKIKEFVDVAKVESVTQFVDYLEAIRGAGDDPATVQFDPEVDAVNVMTVHGAKGLEFSVVFLVNLVADRFPTRARGDAIEVPEVLIKETLPIGDWHQQEERRLFYVGMTRAKDLLYFSWSRDIGGARVKKISPFVLEALDKIKSDAEIARLSPLEKIEKFAPTPTRTTQTLLFDVDVLKLTQGSIDDYLTCAYKYRYIHILRIPTLRHHAIVYGAALHSAVAGFFRAKKSGRILTLPQLLEIFENAWDSEGFLTIEHEEKRKSQGKLALQNFWQRESKSKDLPSLIEARFDFALKGVTITGRFDRVDVKPGGKITIIDYKSSENIDQDKADSQAKESIQLAIYALYYFKRHRIVPEKVVLNFLETGIEGAHTPTQKDLEKTEELILETADKIRRDTKNNSFVANPKYFGREPACVYCAYNSICPFSLAKIQ
ncbi:UvrD-helicase domain-containing protein [Candidatus Curtissbacteria bacterium]|nr:UvrD-helicase domain-containing protein [Candidatus Curtissbacteria bacterium]